MLVLPLQARWIDCQTNQGIPVRAWRAFVELELIDQTGTAVQHDGFIDTGAPFNVIPYTIWHDGQMTWRPLGSQLVATTPGPPPSLDWFGVPCQLGETELVLLDPATGSASRPLRVVAKFPTAPYRRSCEGFVLLGCNLIADNDLVLTLQGAAGQLQGALQVN